MTQRAARFAYPLGIVVAWLAFFSPALLAGRIFSYRDLFFFHEPLRRYWMGLVAAGHAPFLNSALNLGTPILANPNDTIFYPGNLLFLVLPFGAAWNLYLAGHVLWAALGTYWLARRLNGTRLAALSGALVFAFCGPLVSSLNYCTLLVAASWIPWTAGCAVMAWRRGGIWTAATGAALAAQVLGGEPTIVMLSVALLVGGYAVGLLRDRSQYRVVLPRGLSIAGIAALLVSIQILPTLFWLPHSGRAAGLPFRESAAYWSLHPARLAELIVPGIFGNPSGRLASEFWGGGLSDAGLPYIMKLYAGWIPLLLLPFALRRSLGRWAAFVFALSLALSLGHHLPGYHLLYDVFPPLRIVRYPEKFTIIAAFALAMATSLALSRDEEPARERAGLLIAAGALLALLPVVAHGLPHISLSVVQRSAQLGAVGQAAVVGVVSALLLLLWTTPRYRRLAAGLIPVVIVLDLAAVTFDIARTAPKNEADAPPALLAGVSKEPSMPLLHLGDQQADAYFAAQRDPVLSMRDALHPFTGLRWGTVYGAVDDIDRLGWTVAAARAGFLRQSLTNHPAEALSVMRACGIGRVVSLAPLAIVGLHEEATLPLQDGPTIRVYATDAAPSPLVRFEQGTGTLAWKEEAPHRISISVDAAAESTLVVTRNAFDGWSAVGDGRAIALSKTPEGLLRLVVPQGTRHVTVSYTPPGLLLGALLTATGIAMLAAWRRLTHR